MAPNDIIWTIFDMDKFLISKIEYTGSESQKYSNVH